MNRQQYHDHLKTLGFVDYEDDDCGLYKFDDEMIIKIVWSPFAPTVVYVCFYESWVSEYELSDTRFLALTQDDVSQMVREFIGCKVNIDTYKQWIREQTKWFDERARMHLKVSHE